jgi:hypothetical protein
VALAFALLLCLLSAIDARTLFLARTHPALPCWLRPAAHTCWRDALAFELLVTLRTRSSVLRIVHAYRGHTLYTRAQLTHILATALSFSLLFALLLTGRQHENCSNISRLLTILAASVGGSMGTIGRLAFRAANLSAPHARAICAPRHGPHHPTPPALPVHPPARAKALSCAVSHTHAAHKPGFTDTATTWACRCH